MIFTPERRSAVDVRITSSGEIALHKSVIATVDGNAPVLSGLSSTFSRSLRIFAASEQSSPMSPPMLNGSVNHGLALIGVVVQHAEHVRVRAPIPARAHLRRERRLRAERGEHPDDAAHRVAPVAVLRG